MIRLAPIYTAAYPLRGRPCKQPWADRPPISPPLAASPVIVRFLIDECLSVDPVAVASRAGHDAHIGEAG
jgi:hypothetical protein